MKLHQSMKCSGEGNGWSEMEFLKYFLASRLKIRRFACFWSAKFSGISRHNLSHFIFMDDTNLMIKKSFKMFQGFTNPCKINQIIWKNDKIKKRDYKWRGKYHWHYTYYNTCWKCSAAHFFTSLSLKMFCCPVCISKMFRNYLFDLNSD